MILEVLQQRLRLLCETIHFIRFVKSATTPDGIGPIRLYQMPDRLEVINNLDVETKAPLSRMQLWGSG
jgi:hypothetical protein